MASLLEAARRNLSDAERAIEAGLSAATAFKIAYTSARQFVVVSIRASGFRPRGLGAHYTTFLALPLAMGDGEEETARYFDRCRTLRNDDDYGGAAHFAESEARELMGEVRRFASRLEAWLAEHHADLL